MGQEMEIGAFGTGCFPDNPTIPAPLMYGDNHQSGKSTDIIALTVVKLPLFNNFKYCMAFLSSPAGSCQNRANSAYITASLPDHLAEIVFGYP